MGLNLIELPENLQPLGQRIASLTYLPNNKMWKRRYLPVWHRLSFPILRITNAHSAYASGLYCIFTYNKTSYTKAKFKYGVCRTHTFELLEDKLSATINSTVVPELGRALAASSRVIQSPMVAIHFSSMAIGVGRLLTSTVVRHGWLSLKYWA